MKNAKILVIEDNEEVRENLSVILSLHGYEVTSQPNGLEGVKSAIETPPDIILCDVMMPELDGYGVLNLLSENERTAGIPFVFITARTEKEDIRRGMNLGADDYITKPFFKDELLKVVETRLKKAAHRLRSESEKDRPHLSNPDRGKSRLEQAFDEEGRNKVYENGQAVVREGEYPHNIFRINSGRIHLVRTHEYGRDYIIADLGPGELFGLPTVLERTPFHYTARVASELANCQLLPTSALLQLINSDRSVTEALMHLLAGRVMERSERLVNQAYDSVRRRTALVLCDLREKYGDTPIELSREELAQLVGTTKESVIRALSDFKREGLVSSSGRSVVVNDADTLRALLV